MSASDSMNSWLSDLTTITTNYAQVVAANKATTPVPAANATPHSAAGGLSMTQLGIGVLVVVALAVALKKVM